MKFMTKLMVAVITISATIVGSIWTGFETLDDRMDSKVSEGKKEVMTIIYNLKDERNALIKAQDDKVSVQLAAINNDIGEVRKDVRSLLGLVRRSQVVFLDDRINDVANSGRKLDIQGRRN
jgi:hypothetical protein